MLYQQQEQWVNARSSFSRAADLYESMGQGFESDVADEWEEVAVCFAYLGEIEKGTLYYTSPAHLRTSVKASDLIAVEQAKR